MKKALVCLSVLVCLCLSCAAPCAAAAEGRTVTLSLQGDAYSFWLPLSHVHVAYPLARYGTYSRAMAALLDGGADCREVLNALSPGAGDALERVLRSYESTPVDASVRVGRDGPECLPHRVGYAFDRTEVCLSIGACLDGQERDGSLVLHEVIPSLTTQQVRECTRLLAKFDTDYSTQARERSHNLALCAAALNGVIVPAGQRFSFNAAVGPRTCERGYKEAPSILDGRYVSTVGGGVCQVSTTVYNAALLAGLPCTANPHSLAVHYVEAGRDAMVSAYSDMTFVNTTAHPLYLYASAQNGRLCVRLFGAPMGKVRLYAQPLVEVPYGNVDEGGAPLPDTRGYQCVRQGVTGRRVRLMREIAGRREVVRTAFYPPHDAVWRRADV